MLKVGLTGGIACGKSYTLKEFEKLGVYAIDADQIARQVVAQGKPAYQKVVKAFSDAVLQPNGDIDRKKLGEIVFSDPEARERLNRIVHPYIHKEENRRLAALQDDLSNVRPPITMTDAALMVETGSYKKYDLLVVVFCPAVIQLRRLIMRDGISEAEARRRIRSQMSILEKIKYGDYIIDNSGKLSNTNEQIHHTFAELMARIEAA